MSHDGRSRGRREDLPLRAEINVTSLVDVAFTLLVIFIITAPILQGGIEVGVPRADVAPLTADEEPLIVVVRANGEIVISETVVPYEDFDGVLAQAVTARNVGQIYIRGDSLAYHGDMVRVFAKVQDLARQEGIRFAIVAEPDASR